MLILFDICTQYFYQNFILVGNSYGGKIELEVVENVKSFRSQ